MIAVYILAAILALVLLPYALRGLIFIGALLLFAVLWPIHSIREIKNK